MSGFKDFMNKVGAFASKAAVKTKEIAGVAATKTKQVSHIAKLNMEISGQKDVAKKAYTELGKLYYEAHHDAPEAGMEQICQQIDMALASVASMEEEIARTRAEMTEAPEDADFETVVDQTQADADVEVEIHEEPHEEDHEQYQEEPHWDNQDEGPHWN